MFSPLGQVHKSTQTKRKRQSTSLCQKSTFSWGTPCRTGTVCSASFSGFHMPRKRLFAVANYFNDWPEVVIVITVAFGKHTLKVGAGLVTVRVLVFGVQVLESVLLVSLQAKTQTRLQVFILGEKTTLNHFTHQTCILQAVLPGNKQMFKRQDHI